MKTKEELEEALKDTTTRYKEIIFGLDNPTCMACLDELRKQQVIDQKIYGQRLMEDTVRKLAWEGLQKISWRMVARWLIRKQVRCWVLKLILCIGKTNFKLKIIAFIGHKITCRKAEELHILNGTDTLGTWSVCDFS